jgi:hypothetical protein
MFLRWRRGGWRGALYPDRQQAPGTPGAFSHGTMTPSSPQNHRWKGRSHSVGDEKGLGMVSMIMVVMVTMMILTHLGTMEHNNGYTGSR